MLMVQKAFIPTDCVAGFLGRKDTFDQLLSYVTYYRNGKLCKETSWNSWRDTSKEPLHFKNVPTTGFMINKGIQRPKWDHFSTGRSMIRIYDPRGCEFEITVENFTNILTYVNCIKRQLQGELVYAWYGSQLVLLPVNSEDYKESTKFTDLQNSKFSVRDLTVGYTYINKHEQRLVYLGRHDFYELSTKTEKIVNNKYDYRYGYGYNYKYSSERVKSKQHIFYNLDSTSVDTPVIVGKSADGEIKRCVDESVHGSCAEFIQEYSSYCLNSKYLGYTVVPYDFEKKDHCYCVNYKGKLVICTVWHGSNKLSRFTQNPYTYELCEDGSIHDSNDRDADGAAIMRYLEEGDDMDYSKIFDIVLNYESGSVPLSRKVIDNYGFKKSKRVV